MDLQRSLLIGAIAVLSFMLLTEWVAFKDDKTQSEDAQTTRLITNADAEPSVIPELEAATVATADEDLPTAPETATSNPTPDAKAVTSSRIVLVRTDSLQLAIDLQGGDIIELALPRHLEKIDNPDIPFVLLEQNEKRTYLSLIHISEPTRLVHSSRMPSSA